MSGSKARANKPKASSSEFEHRGRIAPGDKASPTSQILAVVPPKYSMFAPPNGPHAASISSDTSAATFNDLTESRQGKPSKRP